MEKANGKEVSRIGMFLGATAYGFTHAPIIAVKEIKKSRKRRKLKKGLDAWYNIIKEMEASGKYSEEVLNNTVLWFGEACIQYANMFIN